MKAFSNIEIPERESQPRSNGITMALDKGLDLTQIESFAKVHGEFCDFLKFGWGTARLFDKELLKEKISLLKSYNVKSYVGGTLGELAVYQGKEEAFMDEARELGFDTFEVSDGVINITHDKKIRLIELAKERGFLVLSEIGKKFEIEDKKLKLDDRITMARHELEAGAWKVILEARESGTFGLFDKNGNINQSETKALIQALGLESLIIEAPLTKQQSWLIQAFGHNVNLGNIAYSDCLTVETLRMGLRGGTMRNIHTKKFDVSIDLGPQGALEAAKRNDLIVVIDALRASSTIVTAIANGIKSVKTVVSIEDCVGDITAGERGGNQPDSLMFDNSPTTFHTATLAGRELILTTTNGTECIKTACSGDTIVLIGCLLNLDAVTETAKELALKNKKNITLIVAGRNNMHAAEDHLVATEIATQLTDASMVKGELGVLHYENISKTFLNSESGQNLVNKGKLKDIEFCMQKNLFSVTPIFNKEKGYIEIY